MRRDLHLSFLSAQAVAVAWIGALIGPVFVLIGLGNGFSAHFYIGVVLVLVVIATIREGFQQRRRNNKSDLIVYCIIPISFLALGVGYVVFVLVSNY